MGGKATVVGIVTFLYVCLVGRLGARAGDVNPLACNYEELRGYWIFEVGDGGYDKTINCMTMGKVVKRYRMLLDYPDVVKDEFGNVGFWTMVDSLGFEVVVHGRKFFSYIKFKSKVGSREVRFCNETILGSSHDVLGRDWACFFGRKAGPAPSVPRRTEGGAEGTAPDDSRNKASQLVDLLREKRDAGKEAEEENNTDQKPLNRLYRSESDLVERINAAQSSWAATGYDEYKTMTVSELLSRAGNGRLQRKTVKANPAPITAELQKVVEGLPESFDWRNVKGVNYVSPVRDQGKCGSCYAFASAAMNEARLSIFTNRTVQVVLSPQDVVDCTSYSLGCDGGSSYAIAGKYGEDYGMVEESCNPYRAVEGTSCGTRSSCKRYYFTGYEYIGGYYGGCNEAEMLAALVTYGPLAIAIKTKEDLMFYKSGIYHATGLSSRFNPFVEVDHAVTLVGYGVDRQHGKYWIIKNSWGTKWGDGGYFHLRRGVNECGVESDAMHSFPIF